ncbi:ribonuclease H-like domain-containing protein [Tanacetum coccineum]
MNFPKGYSDINDKRVCKLVKSLYGLKQAPKKWNEKLASVLSDNGFVQSLNDFSLSIKNDKVVILVFLVSVDDIILLSEFGMLACKPCSTHIKANPENKKIISKFGNDEALTVHCLSQIMQSPMKSHLRLAFRVLRYLKIEPGLGITFRKSYSVDLKVFVDSDWVKCKVLTDLQVDICLPMEMRCKLYRGVLEDKLSQTHGPEIAIKERVYIKCSRVYSLRVEGVNYTKHKESISSFKGLKCKAIF